jgi:hypothetical protein
LWKMSTAEGSIANRDNEIIKSVRGSGEGAGGVEGRKGSVEEEEEEGSPPSAAGASRSDVVKRGPDSGRIRRDTRDAHTCGRRDPGLGPSAIGARKQGSSSPSLRPSEQIIAIKGRAGPGKDFDPRLLDAGPGGNWTSSFSPPSTPPLRLAPAVPGPGDSGATAGPRS